MKNDRREETKLVALGFIILAILTWNFWLPSAEDFFNQVSAADENRPFDLKNVDFSIYYETGSRFEVGAHPYYFNDAVQGQIFSHFWYPPTFLPVYGLLSRLDYDLARLVWAGLYGLSYLLTFGFTLYSVQPRLRLRVFFLATGLTLTSFPLMAHINVGQADLFVASLTFSGFLFYARRQRLLAAALFSIATLVKVSPVLFLLYFVLYLKDLRFLIYYSLACLGIVLLSLLWVPFSLYPEYVLEILPEVGSGSGLWMNQSLLKYLADQRPLAQLVVFSGMAALGVFLWFASRKLRLSQAPRAEASLAEKDLLPLAAFMLNLLVIFIFTGRLWSMAYTWAILPSTLLLVFLFETSIPAYYKALFALGVVLLNAKIYGYPPLDSMNLWGAVLVSFLLALLLLGELRQAQSAP